MKDVVKNALVLHQPTGIDPNSQSPWISTVDMNSCNSAYDGIQCSVSCPPGFSQVVPYCDDGKWVNSFAWLIKTI